MQEAGKVINKGKHICSIPKLNQEITAAANLIHRSKTDVVVVTLGSNDLLQCPDLAVEACGERRERFDF